MLKGLGSQRLVALFVGGWVLFNFPLLGLWDRDATVWGIPLFPLALFLLWGGLIAMLAWLMEWPEDRLANRNAERPDDRAEAPPPPAPPQE
ncbi:MAG TPA: hypothetical protein PK343_12740 [Giesbergeria sp.]|nr:hypothetical protein [Giesbergeria sp.]